MEMFDRAPSIEVGRNVSDIDEDYNTGLRNVIFPPNTVKMHITRPKLNPCLKKLKPRYLV